MNETVVTDFVFQNYFVSLLLRTIFFSKFIGMFLCFDQA